VAAGTGFIIKYKLIIMLLVIHVLCNRQHVFDYVRPIGGYVRYSHCSYFMLVEK